MSDEQPSVYDRIWEFPRKAGFFDPSTTQLVSNIEDLTEVLQSDFEEVGYTEEDIDESSDSLVSGQRAHMQEGGQSTCASLHQAS